MFGLLPKNLEFFDCFERAAQNAVHTAELLADFSNDSNFRNREVVMAIMEAEHVGDRLMTKR